MPVLLPGIRSTVARLAIAVALLATLLTVPFVGRPSGAIGAVTPLTVPTCGTSGTPSVVAQHGPHFYIDTSSGLTSGYVAYTVRAGTVTRSGLWMNLSGFTGGVLGLASGENGSQPVARIAPGGSATRYFLLTASGPTTAAQRHTVTLYDGEPGTGTAVCTYTSTINTVAETIKALANKVRTLSTDFPVGTARIGDTVTVSVTGDTGQLGAGPTNDPGILSNNPNALASFPASAWRLERAEITIKPTGVEATPTTFVDRLYLPGASGPDRPYTASYRYRAIGPTANTTVVNPIQFIASGTQVKHTDLGGMPVAALPAVSGTAALSLEKAADESVITAGSSSAARTVTYTATITNTGDDIGTLDRLVDTIPAGATYVTGSATIGGAAAADPDAAGGTLTWQGPIRVPAFGSSTLTYQLVLADVTGFATNSMVGRFGNVVIDRTENTTDSAPATATVEIRAVSGSVTATADTATITAGTQASIDVLANDTSSRNRPLTVTAVGTPTQGSAAIGPTGDVVYTPPAGFSGTVTISYTVSDGVASASGTITVTVNPTAVNDFRSGGPIGRNNTRSFTTVLANDACTGCTVALEGTFTSSVYTLTVNTDGTFSLRQDVNSGTSPVTFSYRATDPTTTASATATVTVTLSDAAPDSATTPYQTAVSIPIAANDTCPSGCNPSAVTSPSNGTFTYGTTTYTPNNGFWGPDSFTYKVQSNAQALVQVFVGPPTVTRQTVPDGTITGTFAAASCSGCTFALISAPTGGTLTVAPDGSWTYVAGSSGANTATYRITDPATGLTVDGTIQLNVGPDAVDDTASTLVGAAAISGSVLTNDVCPATCTVTKLTDPAFGTLSLGSNGAWTFSSATEIGTAVFTYRIESSVAGGVTDTATVTITVDGGVDDIADTAFGSATTIPVLTNDPCVGCTLTGAGNASAGSVTVNQNGTVTYTPPTGFTGRATFTYTLTRNGRSSTVTVTVYVAPEAVDDEAATVAGTAVDIDVLDDDTCAVCTAAVLAGPANGTVTVTADGLLRYTPTGAFTGTDTFTYRVTDAFGRTDDATVTVVVAAPPSPQDDVATTPADTPIVVNVRTNDGCPSCQIEKVTDPQSGTAAVRADNQIQFVPAPGTSGRVTITYSALDPSTGLSANAVLTVDVTPAAVDDLVRTAVGVTVPVAVVANDACTGCTVTIVTPPASGSATVVGTTITYEPPAGFSGTRTFTYRVTDPVTGHADAVVTVEVNDALPDVTVTPYEVPVDIASILANDICPSCSVRQFVNVPRGNAAIRNAVGVTYTPPTGFTGLVIFGYEADAAGPSSLQASSVSAMSAPTVASQVTILVGPPEETIPVASGQSASGDVTTNDCGTCVTTIETPPSTGEITLEPDGTWSYTSPATFVGQDVLVYRVTDTVTGATITSTITFVVSGAALTPAMTVTKTAGTPDLTVAGPTDRLDAGDTIPYTITVTNSGNVDLDSISVTDPLVPTLTCTPALSGLTLAPSDTLTCTGDHTVTQAEVNAGSVANTASASASSSAGPVTQTGEATTSITRTASLTVDATVRSDGDCPGTVDNISVLTGTAVEYCFTVTNTGNVTLTTVTLGLSTSDTPTLSSGTIPLAPGATAVYRVTRTVTTADVVTGTANATSAAGAVGPVSDVASVTVTVAAGPALTVAKTTGSPDLTVAGPADRLDAGDRIPYTITVTNSGNVDLDAITVTDPLVPTLSCTPNLTGLTLSSTSSVTCTGDHTVTQAELDAGTISNTATATANSSGGPVSATGVRVTSLDQVPASTLELTFSTDGTCPGRTDAVAAEPGTTVYVCFVVTNTGNVTLTSVTVTSSTGVTPEPLAGTTPLAPGATMVFRMPYVIGVTETIDGTVNANAGNTAVTPGTDSGAVAATTTPAPRYDGPALPATGSGSIVRAFFGAALALVGAAVLMLARRRRPIY